MDSAHGSVRGTAARMIAAVLVVVTTMAAVALGAGRAAAEPAPRTTATDGRVCVGAETATLGKVFDAVYDSFTPSIPAAHRAAAAAAKRRVAADLHRTKISTLGVSMHPSALGASPDAPMNKYRDPLSQWIVTQLVNVRNGDAAQPIRADNLTLSQAVETAWLYFYVTTVIPLTLVKDTMPGIYSLGPVSIGTLITLPISIGMSGMRMFYKAISNAIIGKCLVRMTAAERAAAGKPDPDLRFTAQVPRIIREIAAQVAIAEPGTCEPVSSLPLSRIVERTSKYLQATAPNKRAARDVVRKTKQLQRFMRQTRVPHNLVPTDPADFNAIESLLSMGLGLTPYVGGAVTDILVGLGSNVGKGQDLGATVPLGELTVTKTLTAGYYSYAVTTQFVSVVQGFAADALATSLGGLDIMPRLGGVINAPNTYGLVVYHNALRSLCLVEDRKPAAPGAKPVATW